MQIAEALRLLRTRQGLTQTAASKREGAPDFRNLFHWETSLRLLSRYLGALDLDFCDLQDALDKVEASTPAGYRKGLEKLERRIAKLEQHLVGGPAVL